MKIILSILFVLFISNISSSKLGTNKGVLNAEGHENPIKFNLISDEKDGPNKFKMSYEVTYDEYVFKRFEICHIVEQNNSEAGASELTCIGTTEFLRTDDVKNVTNIDKYTYSTNGFNHSGAQLIESGSYYLLKNTELYNDYDPEPIFLKLNLTVPEKNLQFEHIGNDKLSVNLTINSTFFSLDRWEKFSVGIDSDTNTTDLYCHGEIKLTVRNTDTYQTVQKEFFNLDESYNFFYINDSGDFDLINNNSTNN